MLPEAGKIICPSVAAAAGAPPEREGTSAPTTSTIAVTALTRTRRQRDARFISTFSLLGRPQGRSVLRRHRTRAGAADRRASAGDRGCRPDVHRLGQNRSNVPPNGALSSPLSRWSYSTVSTEITTWVAAETSTLTERFPTTMNSTKRGPA